MLIILTPVALSASNQTRGWKGLVISEIFPNPAGTDKDKEWIKIYNSANTEINLKDWIISDNYGHICPYIFTKDLWLEDDDYFILERKESNIILNNFLETISLFSSEGELADQVSYIQAPEDSIYTYNQGWLWQKISLTENSNQTKEDTSKDEPELENNWDKLSEAESEEVFTLSGIVLTLPGQVSSQYFFLSQDRKQSRVVQIYSYNKVFPEIEVGETLKVSGRFSSSSQLYRLKTSSLEDFYIDTKQSLEKIIPLEINNNLNEKNLGKIFSIKGKIIKVKKNSLTVQTLNHKGDGLVELELDTELLTENFLVNQILEAKGVLKNNSQGYIFKLIPDYGLNIYNNISTSSSALVNKKSVNSKTLKPSLKIILPALIFSLLIAWLLTKRKTSVFDL
ncbi:MAG: lamin tail domain-containing protein [Candidatus Pacebacteria bacterium]|nr:lamin tail domain-containing protein [Candidatus Paceibacterota bacterium]